MTVSRPLVLIVVLLLAEPLRAQLLLAERLREASAPHATAAQPADARDFTPADKAHFLRTAEIARMQPIGIGVTGSLRATLTDGRLTHDAQIQTIDVWKPIFEGPRGMEINYRDSWRFNIAAHRLDVLLNLNMVPVSVEREVSGDSAAVTWWVDDVVMDERTRLEKRVVPPNVQSWTQQMYIVKVFDELIYNTDRNPGNLLMTRDGRVWMIDHSRAFRIQTRLRHPENLIRCDRRLLDALRELSQPLLTRHLDPFANAEEIEALLARRDAIVAFFDAQIARHGEATILFDLLPSEF